MLIKQRLPRQLKSIVYFIPALLWMGSVLFLSTRSVSGIPIPLFKGADKIAHFVFYSIMVYAFAWGYLKTHQLNLSKLLLAAYWSVLFGGLIELVQHYLVNGRTGEWADFFANTIGVLIGSFIIYQRYLKRTTQN